MHSNYIPYEDLMYVLCTHSYSGGSQDGLIAQRECLVQLNASSTPALCSRIGPRDEGPYLCSQTSCASCKKSCWLSVILRTPRSLSSRTLGRNEIKMQHEKQL